MAKTKWENQKKEFKSETLKDFKETDFNPQLIPWINDIQINQDISVET